MKCLRCGRTLKNGEMECSCGHFYETNLKGNRITKSSSVPKKKSKRKITLVELLSIFVILTIFLIIMIPEIFQNDEPKTNEQCDIKCEGSSYSIKNNRCICSNGKEYPIE